MTAAANPPIDLNSDMGESNEPAQIALDESLLAIVTSVNIACGGHAGDDDSMARTIRAAIARNVAIGAHPGFPDRENFGRTDMDIPAADIERTVTDQVRALDRVARQHGARLSHVKPHGALYHAAMTRPAVADAIANAVAAIDEHLTLVGLAGAPGLARWQLLGRPVAAEAFADRRYEPDGSLRARTKVDALITDLEDAAAQAVDIATGDGITSATGTLVPIRAQTICIHSDTPGALAVARSVHRALLDANIRIAPLAPAAHS
jgi:UPF0271 protein